MQYGGVIKIETQGLSQGSIIGDVVSYASDSQYLSQHTRHNVIYSWDCCEIKCDKACNTASS